MTSGGGTPIRVLDNQTIGQIAAGEIVERPASVVKELVENAVDAGAGRITVAVRAGGLEAIDVIDDGWGIAASELELAVRRHATSKLRGAADLESIASLGFRGEGLASIAAVSAMEIVSRARGETTGARVRARGETSEGVEPSAAPPGTSVHVAALFSNVPVRREHLRSPAAEFGRISSWLAAFALAYPQVTFTLRHDGRDVWVMPASADARERLAMVFGRAPAPTMLELDPSAAATIGGNLRGYVSAPGFDRPDRRLQLLFVNGRLLRSTLLAGAWSAGYATYAMSGRHPYGALFLELPPGSVDPNVHPTKSDVRLRYGAQVNDAVRRAIAATLQAHAAARFAERTAGWASAGISAAPPGIDAGLAHVQSLFGATPQDADALPPRRMRVLDQLHCTYILAADGEGLLLVDQHAAHERIAYERIVEAARSHAPSEPLLVPAIVELDAAQSEELERSREALQEGGLQIEPFGERTYRIVATPAGYGARPFDLTGFLADLNADAKRRGVRERIWATLACHSVTVAGERLDVDEMTMLIERLARCANPMHCPHGRPTMVRYGPDEIARAFKRV